MVKRLSVILCPELQMVGKMNIRLLVINILEGRVSSTWPIWIIKFIGPTLVDGMSTNLLPLMRLNTIIKAFGMSTTE